MITQSSHFNAKKKILIEAYDNHIISSKRETSEGRN